MTKVEICFLSALFAAIACNEKNESVFEASPKPQANGTVTFNGASPSIFESGDAIFYEPTIKLAEMKDGDLFFIGIGMRPLEDKKENENAKWSIFIIASGVFQKTSEGLIFNTEIINDKKRTYEFVLFSSDEIGASFGEKEYRGVSGEVSVVVKDGTIEGVLNTQMIEVDSNNKEVEDGEKIELSATFKTTGPIVFKCSAILTDEDRDTEGQETETEDPDSSPRPENMPSPVSLDHPFCKKYL